ncbi:MAG TPA: MBL fold metallo-hydrolase [Steroidobacteraceae bacterium]|nr:MBL fold metallo-hydrolase [Steroidobacteraceae bacterium]
MKVAGLILGVFAVAGAASATDTPSATLQSYARARAVLDAGVRAMGGAAALTAVRSVRRDLTDQWVDPGQGQRPWKGAPGEIPPANGGFEATEALSFIDYAQDRWFESQRYVDSPQEYALVLDVVTAEHGFRTIRYIKEDPYYDPLPAADLTRLLTQKSRRNPEGILRMALSRPETLQWVGTTYESGRPQEVISFADSLGTRVSLYFDQKTHHLSKLETLRDHPVAGDTNTEILYSDYRAVGALMLPFRYLDRTAGLPTHVIDMRNIDLDASLPGERFEPPRQFVIVQHEPERPRLERISDSLYLIRAAYNVMFSVFPDHVIVFEAPLSDAYASECLDLIHATAPGKPIRYVVASHFHFDHIAGLRTYVAEGVPILAPPDARGVIEKVVASQHTMRADTLAGRPARAVIETVSGSKVLDAGGVRARLYDFGPAPHVAQMLVGYFPDEKLLWVPDLMDVLTDELVIAGVDSVPMLARIRELGLEVERFVPVHGVPITGEQFQKAFAVRAKYVH